MFPTVKLNNYERPTKQGPRGETPRGVCKWRQLAHRKRTGGIWVAVHRQQQRVVLTRWIR